MFLSFNELNFTDQVIIDSYINMGYTQLNGVTASNPHLSKQESGKELILMRDYSGMWTEAIVDNTQQFKLPIPTISYTPQELLRKLQIDKLI
jgi:hypothetical protein